MFMTAASPWLRVESFGGKATVVGTFVGAPLIGTINKDLIIMGLDVSEQMMIAGGFNILALAFGRRPTRT
jgi:ribose transport system permease protein